jgi:hypothetical protein
MYEQFKGAFKDILEAKCDDTPIADENFFMRRGKFDKKVVRCVTDVIYYESVNKWKKNVTNTDRINMNTLCVMQAYTNDIQKDRRRFEREYLQAKTDRIAKEKIRSDGVFDFNTTKQLFRDLAYEIREPYVEKWGKDFYTNADIWRLARN